MKTLYLHIGWSKTGTSAVQFQLDQQRELLAKKGILYSKSMQMNDQAHHHFALAFSPIHGYQPKYNIDQAFELLNQEMEAHSCQSLLLSSELSSFYFAQPKFCEWVKRFDEVKVIATVRRQSELLLSLFNQLVKDPQVRFKGTFFQMVISNIPKMNFFQNLQRWASVVGDENIVVFNYEDGIVDSVLNYFDLSINVDSSKKIVNPSLPNEYLLLLQERGADIQDPAKYRIVKEQLLDQLQHITDKPKRVLVTQDELRAIDNHFDYPNNVLAARYLNRNQLFSPKNYDTIYAF